RDRKAAARQDELERLPIGEVSMLDGQHAVSYRALDRARRVGMRTHIEAGHGGFVHDGANLLFGVLIRCDPVRWRGDPAIRHDLDVMRALADFITDREPKRVDAIAQTGDSRDVV